MRYQSAFISYGRPDAKGIRPQVKVETGTLPVKSISDAGKMKKVTFDISALGNAKLKRDPYANINPNEAAYVAIEAAYAAGEPVEFRIEAQRKASLKIASTIAMKDLDASSQTVRCLVAAEGHSTDEGRTTPEEDQKWSEVAVEQADDYIDTNAGAAASGFDRDAAVAIYHRVAKSQGADAQSAIAVAAVLAIFGVDVYAK